MNAPEPIPFKAEGPRPLLRAVPSGEPYPVHALGPLQEAVEAVQGMTLAPVAIPAQSALAVASLAVQGFADVETLGGNRALSLYCLTIAQSGERKTSCDIHLMAGLREFERERAQVLRAENTAWQNRHALWKGERETILAEGKRAKGKDKVAAEADLAALGPEPAAPPLPDRVVTEPTFEGLTRLFANGQPSLGIFADEGAQFLGGHAMNRDNRQKTLAALNDLWQGNPIRRTRQGEGAYTLYGRRLAVHLMVQPGPARAFMADPMAGDTGFLPRFLICEPSSTIGTRLHGKLRPENGRCSAFSGRLRTILETALPMDEETRELRPRVLGLSREARATLIDFADNIEMRQAPDGDLTHVTGYASKAAEQAPRIAGVLTLWGDLQAPRVEQQAMAWGCELATFYLGEAARLADAATVSVEAEWAETLRKWLLQSWQSSEVTLRDVLRLVPIRALRDNAAAKKAIAMLVEAGWLMPLPPGTVVNGMARKGAWRIVREADGD